MKKLLILILVVICAVLALAQDNVVLDEKDPSLAPPPMLAYYDGNPVYRIGPEVKEPYVITQPEPPPLKDGGIGSVLLWCIVGTDGKAHMIKIAKHKSMEADMKAVENLKQWKFKPGKFKKDEVDVVMLVAVQWR